MSEIVITAEYKQWLYSLKQEIKTRQIKATISVNSQMILLYWEMGRQITEKQENTKWGSKFIEQLNKDLKEEFPEMTGFSKVNLLYMKRFYQFYLPILRDGTIVQQVAKQSKNILTQIVQQPAEQFQLIANMEDRPNQNMVYHEKLRKLFLVPWWHHIKIIEKTKNISEALFYINKIIENNWSRSVLEYQIEGDLYNRQGKAITNFQHTLPDPQGDLANELIKNPYNFEFLRLSEKVRETDLENALVLHIQQFLLELGVGFAYMGQQFALKVGEETYRTDLLFYHTKLKCYVVIELKTRKFEPEFIGKLNFYLTAVNELVKDDRDAPTIGILLCKNKNNYAVEFSLKDVNNPIGVSTFYYTELPEEVKSAFPSVEKLQTDLENLEKEYEKK